jgi:hypothetical protein
VQPDPGGQSQVKARVTTPQALSGRIKKRTGATAKAEPIKLIRNRKLRRDVRVLNAPAARLTIVSEKV